jgi:hypothetical protein
MAEGVVKRMIGWGLFFVVLGLWIWLSALGVPYISFATNWPLLLVALGVYIIAHRARRHRRWYRKNASDVLSELESGRIDADKAVDEIRRSK